MSHQVGLEVEWYLSHVIQDRLSPENIGAPGVRGDPIETAPVEPGYSYHSETNLDTMQPVFSELADAYSALMLPLRSIENEWGPGQVECTFEAGDALRVADDYILFRTATRQICRRRGLFATFMCRPRLAGHYPSGWHLHQSIKDPATGQNHWIPEREGEPLSPSGQSFLAGLIAHALPATVFATPTVNGYRRFRPNSLAPDRVTWSHDHRGVLMRVLGGVGDPTTRIENRGGEPAANPYLYFASQIMAGVDGMARNLALGPPDDEPYDAARPRLPTNLRAALAELAESELFRAELGDVFLDYYLALKRAELGRFERYCRDHSVDEADDEVTQWEQNEYYDFF